jgi:hypothetical protein
MTLQEVPPLFARIPPNLLGPLTGGHASLYWAILSRFYQFEFEREPFFFIKQAAVETVEEVLRASPLWQERREELLSLEASDEDDSAAPPQDDESLLLRETSRRLLSRLEATGWFHFEYRSAIGHVLNFYPYAARILETLVRVARDEQPLFQGYAHSIASLLKPETFAARPGVSLHEATRHTLEMVRELKILNRNIYSFTQRLLDEVSSAAGILEEGLEHYRHAVMTNYHRLKTVDNLYKWRGEILHRLDRIEKDAMSIEAAGRWYAEQFGMDSEAAVGRVKEDLRVLRLQFETLPQITDDIDARNARFSGVALRKLMYLLRHDKRTEGQLQLIADSLARDKAPDIDFDVFRCDLLSDGFLYTPPRRRTRPEPQPLARGARLDEEELRKGIAPRLRRAFSRSRVDAYVDELLGYRSRAPLSDADADTDEDYVRLIYTVAYGLDGGSRFQFEPEPDSSGARTERKGAYGFPRGYLARKKRRK